MSAMEHRPFHPTSKAHQSFLREILESLQELKKVVDVYREEELIKSQLI
jgi:hypothetical protein